MEKVKTLIINNQTNLNLLKNTFFALIFIFSGMFMFTLLIIALMYGKTDNWEKDTQSLFDYILWSSFLFFTVLFFMLKKKEIVL
ncbi:hypothetical protein [Empedobacter brevis]|uniref:hypothetical protein n=1 Tax=Empedobacter brevis TaxID=247 RepID=UPI00334246E7